MSRARRTALSGHRAMSPVRRITRHTCDRTHRAAKRDTRAAPGGPIYAAEPERKHTNHHAPWLLAHTSPATLERSSPRHVERHSTRLHRSIEGVEPGRARMLRLLRRAERGHLGPTREDDVAAPALNREARHHTAGQAYRRPLVRSSQLAVHPRPRPVLATVHPTRERASEASRLPCERARPRA